MASTGPSPALRALVLLRASYACERCCLPLRTAFSVHHRRPRRMGGTKRADANAAQNLLILCGSGVTGCHGWVESNRTEAYSRGYLLYDRDNPAEHPFKDGEGRWWLLDEEGGRTIYKSIDSPQLG